jgi:hypothetical protein
MALTPTPQGLEAPRRRDLKHDAGGAGGVFADEIRLVLGDHCLDVALSVLRLPIARDALIGNDPHGWIVANDRTANIGNPDACPAGFVLGRIGHLRLRPAGERCPRCGGKGTHEISSRPFAHHLFSCRLQLLWPEPLRLAQEALPG